MSFRPVFALRELSVDLGAKLGSWRLSIVLMVLAGLYHGLLAVWASASPPDVVANIATLLPFWLLYALVLVNTGVCFWRRLPALRIEVAAGTRRRLRALGSYLFHGAFFLIAGGFLLTLLARQEARIRVSTGEQYAALPEQILSQSPPRLLASGVPALDFQLLEIRPEFWRDQLLFTTLEADLELPGARRRTARINRPLWLRWDTFLRLSGFGYSPRYELLSQENFVLDSAFVKLNLFPPGQRDYFNLPGLPHRLYLQVRPDFAVEEGRPVSRSFNLGEPAVDLEIYRGRLIVGTALLRLGDTFEFEGLRLRIPEIRYWGELTIVRDPGAPVLFLGYFLGLLGLALKLTTKPKETG